MGLHHIIWRPTTALISPALFLQLLPSVAAAKMPLEIRQTSTCERCPDSGKICCGGLECVLDTSLSDDWECLKVEKKTITKTITRTRSAEHTVTVGASRKSSSSPKITTEWVTKTEAAPKQRLRRQKADYTTTVIKTTTKWVGDEDATKTVTRSDAKIAPASASESTVTMTTTLAAIDDIVASSSSIAAKDAAATESAIPISPAEEASGGNDNKAAKIAGGILGSLIGIGAILLFILWFLRRKKMGQNATHDKIPEPPMRSAGPTPTPSTSSIPHSVHSGPSYGNGTRVVVTNDRQQIFGGSISTQNTKSPPPPSLSSPRTPMQGNPSEWDSANHAAQVADHRIVRKPVPARSP